MGMKLMEKSVPYWCKRIENRATRVNETKFTHASGGSKSSSRPEKKCTLMGPQLRAIKNI